jgi:molybdopterin-guanine dinucleotide biosynthesis protein A
MFHVLVMAVDAPMLKLAVWQRLSTSTITAQFRKRKEHIF